MAVKIRLARRGRKKMPIYDIVVADSRAPRDGRFIEKLGLFNPNVHPRSIVLDNDRALHWIMVGATPSDSMRSLLSEEGIMLRKHLQVGVNKGAITQEQADERYAAWRADKDAKMGKTKEDIDKAREEAAKKRMEAETAKRKKDEEAQAKLEAEAKAAEVAAAKEAAGETEEAAAEAPAEETPKAEAPTEEAPKEEAPKAEAPKEEAPKAEAPAEEKKEEEKKDA